MVDEAREDSRQRRAARRDSRIAAAEPTPAERRRRRLALIVIAALTAVIIGAAAAGYVVIFVLPPQQLIVRVNDVEYTRGDMVKLLRLRQRSLELVDSQGLNTTDDIFQALQTIVENEVIAQAAPGQGISVSRDEVTNSIRAVLSPSEADSQGKSSAQIEREFRERHRQFLNAAQVSEAEHRDLVRKSLMREKFRQFVGDQVPAYDEQVYLHRIWMNVQDEEIDIMQTKLSDAIGDDKSAGNIRAAVKEIAREFSADPDTFRTGGDMGWVPLGVHEDYEFDFWDLEIGELSGGDSQCGRPAHGVLLHPVRPLGKPRGEPNQPRGAQDAGAADLDKQRAPESRRLRHVQLGRLRLVRGAAANQRHDNADAGGQPVAELHAGAIGGGVDAGMNSDGYRAATPGFPPRHSREGGNPETN